MRVELKALWHTDQLICHILSYSYWGLIRYEKISHVLMCRRSIGSQLWVSRTPRPCLPHTSWTGPATATSSPSPPSWLDNVASTICVFVFVETQRNLIARLSGRGERWQTSVAVRDMLCLDPGQGACRSVTFQIIFPPSKIISPPAKIMPSSSSSSSSSYEEKKRWYLANWDCYFGRYLCNGGFI